VGALGISSRQLAAARLLLGLERDQVASGADLHVDIVAALEGSGAEVPTGVLGALIGYFESFGVRFYDGCGGISLMLQQTERSSTVKNIRSREDELMPSRL
jgi:hypothetical protein